MEPELQVVKEFRERLLSAPAPPRGIPRVPVVVAVVVALVAVPAWATGLIDKVFPEDHSHGPTGNPGEGKRYLLQSGPLPGGRSFRLVGGNGDRFTPDGICVELQLRPPPPDSVAGQIGTSCSSRAELMAKVRLGNGGTRAFGRRRPYFGLVSTRVKVLHVTLRSGRHLDVRPNAPDPARIRQTGLRFSFRYVAFVAPPGDRFKGFTVEDVHGRIVQRERYPTRTPPGTPVRDSPAL